MIQLTKAQIEALDRQEVALAKLRIPGTVVRSKRIRIPIIKKERPTK